MRANEQSVNETSKILNSKIMKAKSITVILILIQVSVLAQHKFLPIIDYTAVCSFNEVGYITYKQNMPNPLYEYKEKSLMQIFYIVEDMPKPKIAICEIENMLEKNIRFNTQELNYNSTLYFQCVVNCKGEAGDYQIIDCPTEFVNIGGQILNVFRDQIIYWTPPIQRGHNVDLLTQVKVNVNKGHFDVFAPVY